MPENKPSQCATGGPQQMSIRVSRWKKQLSSNSCEPKFMVSKTMTFTQAPNVPRLDIIRFTST